VRFFVASFLIGLLSLGASALVWAHPRVEYRIASASLHEDQNVAATGIDLYAFLEAQGIAGVELTRKRLRGNDTQWVVAFSDSTTQHWEVRVSQGQVRFHALDKRSVPA